jgi:hypothetical protein
VNKNKLQEAGDATVWPGVGFGGCSNTNSADSGRKSQCIGQDALWQWDCRNWTPCVIRHHRFSVALTSGNLESRVPNRTELYLVSPGINPGKRWTHALTKATVASVPHHFKFFIHIHTLTGALAVSNPPLMDRYKPCHRSIRFIKSVGTFFWKQPHALRLQIFVRSCHSSGGYPPASQLGGSGSSPGHVGFVVDKVALAWDFSECFDFPCQFSFHQMLHNHLSSGAGTMGQRVASVPSGLSQSHPTSRKLEKLWILVRMWLWFSDFSLRRFASNMKSTVFWDMMLYSSLTFRSNILLPSSGSKVRRTVTSKYQRETEIHGVTL